MSADVRANVCAGAKSGSRAAARGDTIVILGECGAGKTVLFHQLVAGVAPRTVTSMAPTERRCVLHGAGGDTPQYLFVDMPGHQRLREQLERHLPRVRGIVFVVDCGASGMAWPSAN